MESSIPTIHFRGELLVSGKVNLYESWSSRCPCHRFWRKTLQQQRPPGFWTKNPGVLKVRFFLLNTDGSEIREKPLNMNETMKIVGIFSISTGDRRISEPSTVCKPHNAWASWPFRAESGNESIEGSGCYPSPLFAFLGEFARWLV